MPGQIPALTTSNLIYSNPDSIKSLSIAHILPTTNSTNPALEADVPIRKVFHTLSPNGYTPFKFSPTSPKNSTFLPNIHSPPQWPVFHGPLEDGLLNSNLRDHPTKIPGTPEPLLIRTGGAVTAPPAEHQLRQIEWPSVEPGMSSDSYVPRTPIPIKFRNKRDHLPERPLMVGDTSKGPRRSARLSVNCASVHVSSTTATNDVKPQRRPPPMTYSNSDTSSSASSEGFSICFYRNCQAVRKLDSGGRGLYRHLDTHFEPRFQCLTCDKKFSREPNLKRHRHGNKVEFKTLKAVSYWKEEEFAHDLRRPEPGNYVYRDPSKRHMVWLRDLPTHWTSTEA